MEIVLRDSNNFMYIDSQEGDINFCVITEDKKQIDFSLTEREFEHLRDFIRNQIYAYNETLKKDNE